MRARRRGQAGAALHMRIIGLFSVVAAMPALFVAAIAFITLDRGLDNWFSTRVRGIVETSLVVANAYVQEQGRLIKGEALAMAADVNRAQPVYVTDPQRFLQYLKAQGTIRGLPGTMLMTKQREITDRADILMGVDFPLPPQDAVNDADTEEAVVIAPGSKNVMGAVVKLSAYDDRYLFVARPFDVKVAQYLRETQEGATRVPCARRAAIRRAGRVRPDVRDDRARRAARRDLDRAGLRQPARRADPPPHQRGRSGRGRQSCMCASPSNRRQATLRASATPSTT